MQNLFFQAEDGIRDGHVTGVQTCALPILGFPVEVRALSRFQTPAEAQQVKDAVRDGSVDVVIGTHRLLTGEVSFKDLGLVVIDEEQRFGVEHKETLKQLRTNVDVLAMSATPIPRTLEMARSEERRVGKERRARAARK